MSSVDISTLKTTDEWASAITKAFRKGVQKAVEENARLGLAPEKPSVDVLGVSLREGDERDSYRANAQKSTENKIGE